MGHIMIVQPGSTAPDFTLASVQGAKITLASYRDQSNVLLWFSRGFTCPFCRAYMAQLGTIFNELRTLQTTVLQISPNVLSRAQVYFRTSPLVYPFLCDQSKHVYSQYGVVDEGAIAGTRNALTVVAYTARTGQIAETSRAMALDVLNASFVGRLQHHALTAVEQALVLVDRGGIVRWSKALGPLENLPDNKTILDTITRSLAASSLSLTTSAAPAGVAGVNSHAALPRSA
jgi:putative peptide zinc metalloprotease protein